MLHKDYVFVLHQHFKWAELVRDSNLHNVHHDLQNALC